MLLYVALCLAAALASDLEDPPVPVWPQVYYVKTDYYAPLQEIHRKEQFWYDGIQKKSRLDRLSTGVQRYIGGNLKDLGHSQFVWVRPTISTHTTEEHLNKRDCKISNHMHYVDTHFLPNISFFDYIGTERMHGEDGLKYRRIVRDYEEYTIWIARKQGVYTPLKYELKVHDPEHGTLADHHYTDYYEFDTSEIDPQIWNITDGLDCKYVDMDDKTNDFLPPLQDHQELDPVRNEFAEFKLKFNRDYESEDEHDKRLKIFEDNVRFINEHNKAGHSYKLKVNHLADRTEEELAMMRGRLPRSGPSKALPFPHTAEEVERLSQDLPTEFDWRPYGAVTPVKNQGDCGSCWAFSTVGAMEGALFLRNGRDHHVKLSEQALVDCSSGFGNDGCGGGLPTWSFDWLKIHGLSTDDDYGGYLMRSAYCHIDNVTKVATVKDYYQVTPGSEKALQVAVFKYGPISVCIDAVPRTFSFYSHGVYYDKNCDPRALDHAVLLVGYGVLDGEKYWLVKNSWGTNWGVAGYVLLSTKNNVCGIQSEAFYPELV